jgi:lipoate---protein ligase
MKYIDLTLHSPAGNLAADEALLDACEAGTEDEILRFWEPKENFVVVGYANSVATEVNLPSCASEKIPVLRRLSGGGTVLQGPGCLNYSVILRIGEMGPLSSIAGTNAYVLERQKAAVASFGFPVKVDGQTDLVIGDLKFSGNAQRRKRNFLIFHGTFLLRFDISLVEKFLLMPSKQPEYRANRQHGEFLMNLGVESDTLKSALLKQWGADEMLKDVPMAKIEKLSAEKYLTDEWNLKF